MYTEQAYFMNYGLANCSFSDNGSDRCWPPTNEGCAIFMRGVMAMASGLRKRNCGITYCLICRVKTSINREMNRFLIT